MVRFNSFLNRWEASPCVIKPRWQPVTQDEANHLFHYGYIRRAY